MSGIEALGIVLNVLPLIITAIEHYDDALRPFVRYRKFSSKVQRFREELEVERTIFRTECLLLLAAAVPRNEAEQMLCNASHPSWTNNALHEKFSRQLGSLGSNCESIIFKIDEKLGEITKKAEELSGVSAQAAQGETVGDKHWRHRVGKKLKFSISESGLQRTMSELTRLNKTFLTLSNQISRLENQWTSYDQQSDRTRRPGITSGTLTNFEMIRKASQNLYETLVRACKAHTVHLVRLRLEAPCSTEETGVSQYQIHFSLAFTRIELDPLTERHPVASAILPIRGKAGKQTNQAEQIQPSQTGSEENSGIYESWFEIQSTIAEQQSSMDRARPPQSLRKDPRSVPLIHRSQDLCVHINSWQREPSSSDAYQGILSQEANCEHLIRLSKSTTPAPETATPLSEAMIQISGTGRQREMPQFQRLGIAKSMALAVLQFHATQWLSESWHSANIHILGMEKATGSSNPSSPHSPFLNVQVKPLPQTEFSPDGESPPLSMSAFVPNLLLFRLGIMLIELAYCETFDSLRHTHNIAANLPVDDRNADFLFARMLADDVGTSLGVEFAEIVKKCLRCDFGCGEDLQSSALQGRIYQDVVCKLEDLEKGFKQLQSPVLVGSAGASGLNRTGEKGILTR